MLPNSGPRTSKISRDVSNFIVTQVLERSDDLIKNSYRRLTTENVARNEHWARIAENVAEKFDIPPEMERVKSHFHNRKKVLLARIKDELKNVPNAVTMSTDEKIAELNRRKMCVMGEYDEQLARVCLNYEEEEKLRLDEQNGPHIMNMFSETSHQSLLCQLLTAADQCQESPVSISSPPESKLIGETVEPLPSASVSVPSTLPATRAPLLTKLLSKPSTSNENGILVKKEDSRFLRASPGQRFTPNDLGDRKRRAGTPLESSPILPSPNNQYLSHLIVDVTSPHELKRLLSVLIDHGFSRFQHVSSLDQVKPTIETGLIRDAARLSEVPNRDSAVRESFEREYTPVWSHSPLSKTKSVEPIELDIVRNIKSRVERVDVEVKLENDFDEEEGNEEDIDEQTAQLEAQLVEEAQKNERALFKTSTPSKRMKMNESSISGDNLPAICEICGIAIRLNPGGSKWNLYEHVIMKHSTHKPYQCPLCPYQAGRKIRIKKHGLAMHHSNVDPIELISPETKSEWLMTMSECFPNHQYNKKQ